MTTNRIDTLASLLLAGDVVKDVNLTEAINMARRMTIPLERSLLMLGFANDASLERVLQLQDMIDAGKISVEVAVNALEIEVREYGMTGERALEMAKAVSVEKKPKPVVVGILSQLMVDAGVINREQQRAAAVQAKSTGMLEGCILRLNRQVPNHSLAAAIGAELMVQSNQLTKEEAVDSLRFAHKNNISLEQALFEKRLYKQPAAHDFKSSDLFTMAGVITDSDRLECQEERIVHRKPFGEILLQKNLANRTVLDAATQLQAMVVKGKLWPYQAAEVLRKVGLEQMPLNQALSDLPRQSGGRHALRFGELLAKAGICTAAQTDKFSSNEQHDIKIGKAMLEAGLIDEKCLFSTLRCQSLLKYGYLSEEQAIAVLKNARPENISLDQAILSVVRYAPASAQWSWV